MTVDLSVIENLGLKMYVTIPPVISEMIANSWDADSPLVQIRFPTGSIDEGSEIVIEDFGTGMSFGDIEEKFLRVGRKRREEDGRDTTPGGRRLMGRKGIGKLAPFGVAKIVEVETCQNYVANSFTMSIKHILDAARNRLPYFPQPLKINERCEKKQGTRIILKSLNRTSPIDVGSYRRRIAKRFSIIDRDFVIQVNGQDITPEDWLKPEDMQYCWRYENTKIDDANPEWVVNGWIGTSRSPLGGEHRGIIIMTRGKLCQDTPFYFGAAIGQKHAYTYMTGILHAEFLDAEEDLVATYRGSVVWESLPGISLKEWGKSQLREIARQ